MKNVNPPVPTSQENKDKLSDTRRHRFFIIDNEILENKAITKTDFMVYSVIIYHAGMKDYCWPSIATIAEESRCGHNQVSEALKHLQTLGLLKIQKKRTTNLYTLQTVPKNQAIPNPVGHAIPNPVEKQDTSEQDVYVGIETINHKPFVYANRVGYTDEQLQLAKETLDNHKGHIENLSGYFEGILSKLRDMPTIGAEEPATPEYHHSRPQVEIDKERDETRQGMLINMDKVKQAVGIEN